MRFFLDISIDSSPETFDDVAPKTILNFKYLCTGEKRDSSGRVLWYKDTLLSVSSDGCIHGGDLGETSGLFTDEITLVEKPWLVAMKDCTKFVISTHPVQDVVVFGHVIKGTESLQDILQDNDDYNMSKIVITHCGELIRKSKAKHDPQVSTTVSEEITLETPAVITEETPAEITPDITPDITQDITQEITQEITLDITQGITLENEEIPLERREEITEQDSETSESSLEYPSVLLPDFKEPKSFLERGGISVRNYQRKSLRDADGRQVKGRGNFKFHQKTQSSRSRYRSIDRRSRSRERYRSRSRSRYRSGSRERDRKRDRVTIKDF